MARRKATFHDVYVAIQDHKEDTRFFMVAMSARHLGAHSVNDVEHLLKHGLIEVCGKADLTRCLKAVNDAKERNRRKPTEPEERKP